MSDQTDPVVAELRLLREQQWSMHLAVIAKIGETNSRLDETNSRLDETNSRLDETNSRIEHLEAAVDARFERLETAVGALGRYTVEGFNQVVERANALEAAFVRFVDLVREDRLEVRTSIRVLEARLEKLERRSRRPRRRASASSSEP